MYVAFATNQVSVYPDGATGQVKPIQHIGTPQQGLNRVFAVALDTAGNIYVANSGTRKQGASITVYAPGANGDAVMPIRTISGPQTELSSPQGVTLDTSGNLYVANSNTSTITVYAAGANGDVAPINTIGGSNTGLSYPGSPVIFNGMLYVPNGNSTITVYGPGATGNVAPVQTIGGLATGLYGPRQVAVDSNGNVFAANDGGGGFSVTEYSAGANGNVAPIATIAGRRTDMSYPWGVALDASGNIYVSNYHAYVEGNLYDRITVYAAGSNGNVAPIAKFQNKKHSIYYGPLGIAIQ